MVRKLIIKILGSALALWVASVVLSGFSVSGGIRGYLVAGLVLGLLNVFIRPLLKILTLPLIFATLGLFSLVINAAILWFVANALDAVAISGLGTLLGATLIITVVNMVVEKTLRS